MDIKQVSIEITNACNQHCIYCPHDQMKRPTAFMPLDKFKYIVDECVRCEVEAILPFLNGECLLHPQFKECVEYLKKNNFEVIIHTNASVMTNDISDFLIQTLNDKDKIVFSVDSVIPSTYEKIRGMPCYPTFENIAYLLGKYSNKFRVTIKKIITEHNESEAESTLFQQVFISLETSEGQPFNWAGIIESPMPVCGSFCQMFKEMSILVNGDVCLCFADYDGSIILGNVFINTLEEMSSKLEEEQNRFPYYPMCLKCNARLELSLD